MHRLGVKSQRRSDPSRVPSSVWGSLDRSTQRAFTKLPLTIFMLNDRNGPIALPRLLVVDRAMLGENDRSSTDPR